MIFSVNVAFDIRWEKSGFLLHTQYTHPHPHRHTQHEFEDNWNLKNKPSESINRRITSSLYR